MANAISGAKAPLLWAVIICLLFSASVVFVLATRVDDIREIPTAAAIDGWHFYPQALLETAGPPPPSYVLWLRPHDLSVLLKYPELRAFVFAGGDDVRVLDGSLEIVGTPCVYTAVGGRLAHGSRLSFIRNADCLPLRGTPTGDVKLVARLAERQRMSVGALSPIAPKADQDATSIQVIGTPGGNGPFPVLRGLYVEYLPSTRTRRVDLLAYMWQIQPADWIWKLVGLAGLLLVAGVAATPPHRRRDGGRRWMFACRAAVGTGCAAGALGVLYAVIVPPFQAPDEPTHLLGFAAASGRAQLIEDAHEWSRRIHFDRLRFRPEERFRPSDMSRPLTDRWKQSPLPNPQVRGVSTRIQPLVGRLVPAMSAFHTLLALRLLNALVFAVAVAMGTAAVVVLSDVPFPQLSAFAYFFVPTVPFFATHVSNHAWLTSGYVVLTSAVLVTVFGGRLAAWSGILLGLSTACLLALSRSAMPMTAMLAIVVMGRVLLGERGVSTMRDAIRRALIFWGGFAAALAILPALLDTTYLEYVSSGIYSYSARMAAASLWVPRNLPWLLAVGALLAVALEAGLFRVRMWLATRWSVVKVARSAAIFGAAAVGLSMMASVAFEYPTLRYVDVGAPPKTGDYLAEAVLSALGIFRMHDPDFLTSTSFWVGFGWLDAIPPDWFTVILTTMTALALISGLLHLAVRPDVRQVAWLATIAVGGAATFALYALITLKFSPDLHGRYVLGLYLLVLSICWNVLLQKPSGSTAEPASRWMLFLAVPLPLHAYCLGVVLERYF